jgi:Tol biopolymer transport system component
VFQRNAGSARRTVLYSASVRNDGSLRSPPSRIPLDVADLTSYGSWGAGGKALILGRTSGLFRVSKAGGKAEPLPFADASEPAVSRDGSKLVFSQALRDTDIYRVQLQTGEVKKIIASTRRDNEASLSADGRRVAFISERSGADALWVADSDGSRAVPLVSFGGPSIGTPHWSPDGQEIVFDSLLDGSSHIYVVRSSGGTARRITAGEWQDVRPSWSRDGKWVYFGSTRSGEWEIWKAKPAGGEPVQVTRGGGREACEDPDGRFVYYTKAPPERGLWRMPVSGGQAEVVDHVANQGRWTVSRRGVYYLAPDETLEFRDWTTGQLATLRTNGLRLASHAAVAPDDQWLLVAAEAGIGRDLMEVANFR